MGSQEEEEEEDGRSATLMTRIEQCESPDNSSTSQQDAAMLYFTKHLARVNNKEQGLYVEFPNLGKGPVGIKH
jgi:hypothetical protein